MLDERNIGIRRNIKAKALFHLRVNIGSVRSYVCMYVRECVHAGGRVCVHVCMYVCMYVFVHSHGH